MIDPPDLISQSRCGPVRFKVPWARKRLLALAIMRATERNPLAELQMWK
jgi:hypothetical protein